MPGASLVLLNGRIWTGDRSRPFADALAISGNRIIALGAGDVASLRRSSTEVIDLQGGFAMPGFIDNHTHFVNGGLQLGRIDLFGMRRRDELAERVAGWLRSNRSATWLLGGGWDHESWQTPSLPDRKLLDPASPDRPLMLTRIDLHMAVANSAALALAGVTRDTRNPDGGEIERDERGEPTGILKDTAIDLVSRHIPPPSRDDRRAALQRAFAEASRFGVTALCDMSWIDSAFEDIHLYQEAVRERAMTARVDLFTPLPHWERLAAAGVERNFGGAFFRIGGLKGFSDGALGSGTAWMKQPYADAPGCGLPMPAVVNGEMRRSVRGASEAGLYLAIHAIGDRAASEVLEIYDEIPEIRSKRFRIEHAQHLDAELVGRFARSGVVAAMQPYHVVDDGRWAVKRIGEERCRWMAPFRSLVEAGAVVTFGSDWTVAPLDPLAGLAAAVTHRTIDGKNPGGWIPEERLGVDDALRCYTVNNAWAMLRENEIGMLREGMLADVVVLSRDLFAVPPEQIDAVRVEATIVDGRVVYRRE